jgi:hypothetical protein
MRPSLAPWRELKPPGFPGICEYWYANKRQTTPELAVSATKPPFWNADMRHLFVGKVYMGSQFGYEIC